MHGPDLVAPLRIMAQMCSHLCESHVTRKSFVVVRALNWWGFRQEKVGLTRSLPQFITFFYVASYLSSFTLFLIGLVIMDVDSNWTHGSHST